MILQGNVYSTALDMETTVCFVAANNFSKEPPRKVCYLLHGLQGRADNFINYTMLADWCRSYHVLFVLPDGQRSYYTDMVQGQKFSPISPRICPASSGTCSGCRQHRRTPISWAPPWAATAL